MGYDICNYEAVYPPYGTVEDMETLFRACHERWAIASRFQDTGGGDRGLCCCFLAGT